MTGAALGRLLDWCGRHATKILAAGVGIGLLLPWLATLVRPGLIVFIMVPLVVALMRVDLADLGGYVRRLPVIALISLWLLLASPIATWLVLNTTPLPAPLIAAVVLMAAAPPIVSAAAITMILGFDAAVTLIVTMVTMWAVPFVLPPLALNMLGLELDISLFEFSSRLTVFVVVAFALGWLARRLVGAKRIARYDQKFDGLSVVFMLFFAIALMDGIAAQLAARPGYVLLTMALGFACNIGLQIPAGLLFWPLGRRAALAVALMSGNRNMGLMLVVLADRADFDITLFFAMAQVPMYTLPVLLTPVYRRLGVAAKHASRP